MSNNTIINVTFPQKNNIDVGIPGGKRKDIYEIKSNKKTTMDNVTDEDEQYLSAGGTKKLVDTKEDVSNKVKDMTTPEMTEEAYPTVYAVTSYVDNKTDYLAELANSAMQQANATAVEVGDNETGLDTKESLSNKVNDLNNFNPDNANNYYPSLSAFLNYVQMFATQETANAIQVSVQALSEIAESINNKVITEDEVPETAPYFSVEATKAYLSEQLSDLDKCELIEASIDSVSLSSSFKCDSTPSQVFNMINDGKFVVLKFTVLDEGRSYYAYPSEITSIVKFSFDIRRNAHVIVMGSASEDSWIFNYNDSISEENNVEIIDNLESTDTNAALSANQGRVLNEKIGDIETALEGLHAYAQGIVSGGDA